MNIDPATLDTKGIAAFTKPGQMQSTTEFLMAIIPNTIVDAFAKGEILPAAASDALGKKTFYDKLHRLNLTAEDFR